MSLAIIELNDSEILAASGTEILLRQPGYAVLKPDRIETGIDARNIARCNPRETSNRYWSQLNQDSLIIPSRLARHNADIAYTQLLAIHEQAGKPGEILFAVPGSYTMEQLSLLLGIVEACPFSAVGLVDSAIASASAVAAAGRFTHLDIHLHYTVITALEVADEVLRKSVRVVNNNGLADIYDSCASFFAGQFIDQSRFDPLHHAETEQSLYNQIPGCLATLRTTEETDLEIRYRDKRYQARIFRNALLQRLRQHYEKIYREMAGSPASLVSHRLEGLPGFTDPLKHWTPVDELSVFRGCNLNIETIRSTGPALSFITALPAADTPPVPVPGGDAAPRAGAEKTAPQGTAHITHVLINNRAYPLNSRPLYISADGKVSSTPEENSPCSVVLAESGTEVRTGNGLFIYLNGNRISGAARPTAGDVVSFAGSDTMARFIEVTAG